METRNNKDKKIKSHDIYNVVTTSTQLEHKHRRHTASMQQRYITIPMRTLITRNNQIYQFRTQPPTLSNIH